MGYGSSTYGTAPYAGAVVAEPDENAPAVTGTGIGGVYLSLTGQLDVDVAVDAAPLTITTKDILVLKPKMRLPVFYRGKPLHPDGAMRVTATMTASATAQPAPETPVQGETRVPTTAPTWQWLATSVSSALMNEYVDTWPGEGVSPNLTSYFPLRPKLVRLSRGVPAGSGIIAPVWEQALAFATRFDEKMFLTSSAQSQPFTWIGIGQLDGPSGDGYALLNTDGQNATISGQSVVHAGGDLLVRTKRYASFDAYDFNAGTAVRKRRGTPYRSEPFVYTMVFDGANSRFRRFSATGVEEFTGLNIGTNGFTDLIMGGGYGGYKIVFMVEYRYYNSVLSSQAIRDIESYARTTYQFDRWGRS